MYIAVTKFSFYTLISLPVDGVQILAPHVDVDGVVVHAPHVDVDGVQVLAPQDVESVQARAPQVHVDGVQILPWRWRMCTTRRRWAFKYEHHKYMLMVFKHVHHTAMLMAFWKTFCVQLGSKTTYDAFRAALEWPLWRPHSSPDSRA